VHSLRKLALEVFLSFRKFYKSGRPEGSLPSTHEGRRNKLRDSNDILEFSGEVFEVRLIKV
jgi:hypothetical protein